MEERKVTVKRREEKGRKGDGEGVKERREEGGLSKFGNVSHYL